MAARSERIRRILNDPVWQAVTTLALPALLVTSTQTSTSFTDTWLAARFGTPALAAVALVVPLISLMQLVSVGGMGGAIAQSVGRALGAGDSARASALVHHALVIALAGGLLFTAVMIGLGPQILGLLGARPETIGLAMPYLTALFAAAPLIWLLNGLSSVLRGEGNIKVTTGVLIPVYVLQVVLAIALTHYVPSLGVISLAIAQAASALVGIVCYVVYLWGPSSTFALRATPWKLERALFADILNVGLVSSIASFQTGLTLIIVAIWVGHYGTVAIAGYGIAFRLEFFLVVGLSSLGTALVTVLSVNLGAKKYERAARTINFGLIAAAAVFALVGYAVMLRPELWTSFFAISRPVADQATLYLTIVTKVYPVLGFALICYFIGQGVGKPLWFFCAGTVRLVILLVAGSQLGAGVADFYRVVMYSVLAFGVAALIALAVTRQKMTRARAAAAAPAAT
jgi:putative MATE family efflux protein